MKKNHWQTLNRKTTQMALDRAIDAIADLIEIVRKRGEDDKINTAELTNLINKLRHIVEQD